MNYRQFKVIYRNEEPLTNVFFKGYLRNQTNITNL